MNNSPSFIPANPTCVEVEVKPNDDDDTFETNLCCALNHCGKTVAIDSDGPKTIQNVSCVEHGFLTSFPHQLALGEFVRCSANKILAMNGHTLIEEGAAFIIGDEQSPPELIN